ncbi:UNVERIFIED_CONTAM: Zinc finger CCCH domain-containing protein 62 [Sesamum angustifolium]|uniref:Zinc finger CCCH domain-containing protein 62 n=1 Tax=Sesamum angustifolium TaxID=2727405 RepID=A0AAW2LP27_9LAMI
MDICEDQHYGESENDAEYSDDSQEDPTFDVLEETRLAFSNLSFKRKIKTRVVKGPAGKEDQESDGIEMVVLELDEKEQKSYETIKKIVEVGPVERLKVEECKIYLRKHGLRLSGNKETLIQRIKEHIDIVNGDGEKKYPASSFVLNCKGDACMGDIVMFEQNVYEAFNIASRSANGPPCGTRVVAGRIVKESYGAAKQQHTFTIEVLWSKGEKPLPPLHPLLIKGRNLYRLKTMRQKWEDEGERQKILSEKHARGGVARLNREARIQQKEMRKMHKPTRAVRNEHPNRKQEEERREPLKTFELNTPIQPENLHGKPTYSTSNAHMLPEGLHHTQSQINTNCSFQSRHQHRDHRGFHEGQHMNYHAARSPTRGHSQSYLSNSDRLRNPLQQIHAFKENQSPWHGLAHNSMQRISNMNLNYPSYSQQHAYHRQHLNQPVQAQGWEQKQRCRYYVQGRCHFGERCKYVHESAGKKV